MITMKINQVEDIFIIIHNVNNQTRKKKNLILDLIVKNLCEKKQKRIINRFQNYILIYTGFCFN